MPRLNRFMDSHDSFYEDGGMRNGNHYNNNGYTTYIGPIMAPSNSDDDEDRYYQSDGQHYLHKEPLPPPVSDKQLPRRTFSGSYAAHPAKTDPADMKEPKDVTDDPTPKSKSRRHTLQHPIKSQGRILSSSPIAALEKLVISHQEKNKETRRLLKDAMVRLEAYERREIKVEQEKKELELAQAKQGLKVMEKVWGVQDELAKARQDAVVYKTQLEFAEAEIHRARRSAKDAREELDGVERAALEARAAARGLHEEKLALLARDEGRKQGFAEGIARAREEVHDDLLRRRSIAARPHETPLGSGVAFIEEVEDEEGTGDQTDTNGRSSHRRRGLHSSAPTPRSQPPRTVPSTPQVDPNVLRQETEAAEVARREAQRLEALLSSEREEAARERERARARQQEFEREQEAMRQREREREEASRREAEALRDELRREKEKTAEKQRELERKLEQERHAAQIRELERQHEREREEERQRLAEREREREAERERRRESERERQRAEEAERERQREAERERQLREEREKLQREAQKQKEQDKETASISSGRRSSGSGRLPYMPMPPPPKRILPRPAGQPSNGFSMSQSIGQPAQGTSSQQAQAPPPPPTQSAPPGQPTEPPQQIQPNPNGIPRKSALRQPSAEAPPSQLAPRFARNPSTDTTQSRDTLATPPVRQRHRRNSSPDTLDTLQSPSESGMSSFDIVSFPVERQRGRGPLSVIPEGSSVRSGTPSRHSDAPSPARPADSHPPAWVTNPPVDFSKRHDVEQWRRSSSIAATEPNSPDVSDSARDFLGPSSFAPDLQRAGGSTNAQRRTSVQSTEYEIKIEPPSGPPSESGVLEHEQHQRPGLLSPNSAHHAPLPQPTPASPVIPAGVHGLPPNFVAQNFTSHPVRPTMPPPQNPGSPSGTYQNYSSAYVRPDSAASGPPVIPPQMSRPPSRSGLPLGSIYANAPLSSSSSSSGRGHPGVVPAPQFQHQIYGAPPPAAAAASSMMPGGVYSNAPVSQTGSASGSHTPRQMYAPTLPPPAGTTPGGIYSNVPVSRTTSASGSQVPPQMSRPPSRSGLPPGSIYAGVPPSSSSSTSGRGYPGVVPAPQFQHQIYGPPLPAGAAAGAMYSNVPVSRPGSASGSYTPRQMYAPPLPVGSRQGQGPVWMASPSGGGGGVAVPFVPPSPHGGPNMTPGSATPGPFTRTLPGVDEDEDEGEDPMTAETRRNTEVNARRRESAEPLYIPPPIAPPSWGN